MEETFAVFNRLAEEYDHWYEKEKQTFQTELAAFQPILPSLPKPWLEVGVGSGRFAPALGIPWGIDPVINLLRIAKQRNIQVAAGRGEFLPLFPRKIGSVFIILTLCFVPFPPLFLKECHRILLPGGRIVVGFIPRPSPWGKFYAEKKNQGHPVYRLARFYSIEEVEHFFIDGGFTIHGIYSTLFQKPGSVAGVEKPIRGYRPQAGFLLMISERTS